MVVGTLVAALRIAPSKWLQRLGGIYVEVFRNIPLLVLLFISYAGLRRGGRGHQRVGRGHGVARPVHGGLRRRGAALGRLLGRQGADRGVALARLLLPARRCGGSCCRRPSARSSRRSGSLTIAMIKNSAIIGVSLLALPDLLKQARIVQARTFQTDETFFWAAVGYLILTGAVTLVIRNLETPLRDPPMNYLFDPDNWEWLTTGNNVRFILEGFLINLEIALVSMVFALIFGLVLALLRLSRVKPVSVARGRVDRRVPQPAADLPDPLLRARAAGARGSRRGRTRCPRGRPRPSSPGSCSARCSGWCSTTRAVLAEIMRAGILSLPRGQGEAASALGMTYRQSLRHVILPAGPAPHGPRDRVPADHAQQGHDAGLDHRHHRGHAPRPDRHRARTSSPSSRRRSCTSSSSSGSCS